MRPEDETLDYSKWFSDSAARLNDLLTRAAIIWSTSITAINSIELYNLPVVIGGGGPRRNFETIGCLSPSPSPSPSPRAFSLALLRSAHRSPSFRHSSPSSLPGTATGFRRGYQPH